MKTILSTFTILLISQHINSQVSGLNWTTEALEVPSGTEAKIGTATPDPLFILTNNQKRIELDSTGNLKLLKFADVSQTQDRLLYITPDGKFKTTEETGCTNLQIPWRLGGNTIATLANNRNEIGTCDNYDFILKANGNNHLWIKPSGKIGIDESNPSAKFEVNEPTLLPSAVGSSHLLTSIGGNVNNNYKQNTWILRDNGGTNDWRDVRIHDGISVDISFITPGTDTRTWWERQAQDDEQSWGTANRTYMRLKYNQLQVCDQPNAPNTSAFCVNMNHGDAIEVYDEQNQKINFKVSANGATYIGPKRIQSNHLHANSFVQIDGKVACTELVVIDPTKWADFVFDKNYNLKPLSEVEEYYKTHKHLPEIPSEEEVFKNGINTSEMEALLLQKIEELTLYIVDLNKKVEKLESNKKNKQHN